MRTTLKLVLPLAISVLCVSAVYTVYQVRTERRNLRNDLSHRSAVLAENLQESLESSSGRATDRSLNHIVERYGQREHLVGVAVYDADGKAIAITPGLSATFSARPPQATRATQIDGGVADFPLVHGSPFHVYALPLHRNGQMSGSLIVVYDTGFIESRLEHTLRDSLLNTLVQTLLITAFAFLLVRWTFASPLAKMAKWLRTLRDGSPETLPALPQGEIFDQLHNEVRHLAHDLTSARAAARTKRSYFGAQYRQIARRRGPNKAAIAVAHSLIELVWHLLSTGEVYNDLGEDYFSKRQDPERRAHRLVAQLEQLGFKVTLEAAAAATT